MQLRQLEVFLTVVRCESFVKAASTLFISQPTVSAHIRALESELKAKLFVRSTKTLTLTPQGELLYTYASQIVNFCERAKTELADMTAAQQNTLVIAASSVPAEYLLPDALTLVRSRFENIAFRVLQGDSDYASNAVLMGDAHVGIVGEKTEKPNLFYRPLTAERLMIAAPRTPLFQAQNGVLTPEMLKSLPFIMRELGSGTRACTERYLKSVNVDPADMNVVAELSGTEAVMRYIKCGLGASVVSRYAAAKYSSDGDVLIFDIESEYLLRRFYAVTRSDVPLSPAAKCLVEQLEKPLENDIL